MLEAENLTCIRDERTLFTGLGLRISPGDMIQVEGGNGAGKTSLLRILAGLARPNQGQVFWRRREITRARQAYHRQLLFIGHLPGVKPALTALENLAFFHGLSGAKRDNHALWQALEQVGLLGFEEVFASALSAGQQRCVALARLWLSRAPLWMLDEPFTAIDQQGVGRLTALFNDHCRAGGMVLLTSHQALPMGDIPLVKLTLAGEAKVTPCFA